MANATIPPTTAIELIEFITEPLGNNNIIIVF